MGEAIVKYFLSVACVRDLMFNCGECHSLNDALSGVSITCKVPSFDCEAMRTGNMSLNPRICGLCVALCLIVYQEISKYVWDIGDVPRYPSLFMH